MIEILRDEKGNIKAVLEWWRVDKDGTWNKDGLYVWVNECEINPNCRNNGILKTFISKIIIKAPEAEFAYFKRRKYGDRIKLFTKKQWINRLRRT